MLDSKYLKVTIKCHKCGKELKFLDWIPLGLAQEKIKEALEEEDAVCPDCQIHIICPELGVIMQQNSGSNIEIREFTLRDVLITNN